MSDSEPEDFECTKRNCSTKFTSKKQRNQHSKLCGVKTKKFKCGRNCPTRYGTNYAKNLKRHKLSCPIHAGTQPKQFKCTECPYDTHYKCNLISHQKQHQPKQICNGCGRRFRDLSRHKCGTTVGRPTVLKNVPQEILDKLNSRIKDNECSDNKIRTKLIEELKEENSEESKKILAHLNNSKEDIKNKYNRNRHLINALKTKSNIKSRPKTVMYKYMEPPDEETYNHASDLHEINNLEYDALYDTLNETEQRGVDKILIMKTNDINKPKATRSKRTGVDTTVVMSGPEYAAKVKQIQQEKKNKKKRKKKKKTSNNNSNNNQSRSSSIEDANIDIEIDSSNNNYLMDLPSIHVPINSNSNIVNRIDSPNNLGDFSDHESDDEIINDINGWKCICSSSLKLCKIEAIYDDKSVTCNGCGWILTEGMIYHCNKKSKKHTEGYDLCANCANATKSNNLTRIHGRIMHFVGTESP